MRARRTGGPLTAIAVDLDGFKKLNDIEGHAAGDDALRWVAATLRDHVRSYDLVARTGGDEFIVLMSDTDAAAAAATARVLQSEIRKLADRMSWALGASIAPAVAQGPMIDLDALLSEADEAMYLVKESGKQQQLSHPPERLVVADVPTPTVRASDLPGPAG